MSGKKNGESTIGAKAGHTSGQTNGAKMGPACGMSAGERTIRVAMLASNSLTKCDLILDGHEVLPSFANTESGVENPG